MKKVVNVDVVCEKKEFINADGVSVTYNEYSFELEGCTITFTPKKDCKALAEYLFNIVGK